MNLELAAEGMKFLSIKDRKMHPAAQIKKLRRIAVRAMSEADFRACIPSQWHPHPPKIARTPEEAAENAAVIVKKRRRAAAAVEAMLKLNAEHKLYDIPAQSHGKVVVDKQNPGSDGGGCSVGEDGARVMRPRSQSGSCEDSCG